MFHWNCVNVAWVAVRGRRGPGKETVKKKKKRKTTNTSHINLNLFAIDKNNIETTIIKSLLDHSKMGKCLSVHF
jgi:hypothetical protein